MAMQKGWGPFGLHGATQILAAEPRQNSLRAPQSSLGVISDNPLAFGKGGGPLVQDGLVMALEKL